MHVTDRQRGRRQSRGLCLVASHLECLSFSMNHLKPTEPQAGTYRDEKDVLNLICVTLKQKKKKT